VTSTALTATTVTTVPRTPDVKFCGLTRPEDVACARALGARYLGAIRAGGPRHLEADAWRDLLGPDCAPVTRVAVLGRMTPDAIVTEARALQADVVQWHGDPSAADCAAVVAVGLRLWPVLRVAGERLPEDAWALAPHAEALVLDAKVTGTLGGTGVALDWSALAADVARWRRDWPSVRLVIAGGLRPENVAAAIRLLEPDVVDVSSGVEAAPGIKDPERMQAFVTMVGGTG
jgi:phosphoribosylanthranilate isomerase